MTVYFVECMGRIKIGFTSNVSKRMSSLATSAPGPLTLIGAIEADVAVERAFHRMLAHHRITLEWFEDCAEVRTALALFQQAGIESLGAYYEPPVHFTPQPQTVAPEPKRQRAPDFDYDRWSDLIDRLDAVTSTGSRAVGSLVTLKESGAPHDLIRACMPKVDAYTKAADRALNLVADCVHANLADEALKASELAARALTDAALGAQQAFAGRA
jgi:hypothetical protein